MRTISTVAALTLALTAFAPLSAQMPTERKLQVTFDQLGNVTVVAQNVTISEILAEWARLGGTVMVNANRLAGGPVTRFYENRPEAEVIDSLLRQAGGYIATPRRAAAPGASRFEVVQITPTPAATAASYTPPAPSAPVSAPLRTVGSPDDEIPPVVPPGVANPPAAAPAPSPSPAPGPAPGPAPTGYPAPGTSGVAVPVVPVIPIPGGGRTGGPPTTPPTTPPGTTGRGGGGF